MMVAPFWVVGGVYEDMSFRNTVEGTVETYGPFETYEFALSVWRGKMGWHVDNCHHRLYIIGGEPE